MPMELCTQPKTILELIRNSLNAARLSFSKLIFWSLLLSSLIYLPSFYLQFFPANGGQIQLHKILFKSLFIELSNLLLFTSLLCYTYHILYDSSAHFWQAFKQASKRFPQILIAYVLHIFLFILVNIPSVLFTIYLYHHHLLLQMNFLSIALSSLSIGIELCLSVIIIMFCIFYPPLIAIHKQGPISALLISMRISAKNFPQVFVVQALPSASYFVFLILTKYSFIMHFFSLHKNYFAAYIAIRIIGYALFLPWIVSSLIVQLQYLYTEAHKEINH